MTTPTLPANASRYCAAHGCMAGLPDKCAAVGCVAPEYGRLHPEAEQGPTARRADGHTHLCDAEWIPVAERLPDHGRAVHVAFRDSYGVLQHGQWWCDGDEWFNQHDAPMPAPEFWRELPPLPQMGDGFEGMTGDLRAKEPTK